LALNKGGKSASPKAILVGKKILQNFLFYHPYESINFGPEGLLKIALIVTPLLKQYFDNKKKIYIFGPLHKCYPLGFM
jgi:hypothetical protein